MSKQSVKTTIDANIKQNGNQEITGQILNSVLNEMVDNLAEEASTTERLTELETLSLNLDSMVGNNVSTEIIQYTKQSFKYLETDGKIANALYETNYVSNLIPAKSCYVTGSFNLAIETGKLSVAFYGENANLETGAGFISGFNIAAQSGNYKQTDYLIHAPKNALYMAFAWIYSPSAADYNVDLIIKGIKTLSDIAHNNESSISRIDALIGDAELPVINIRWQTIDYKYLGIDGNVQDIAWSTNHVSDFIGARKCKISGCFAQEADKISVAFYDDAFTFISGINIANESGNIKNIDYPINPPANAKYMRVAWIYSISAEDYNLDLHISSPMSITEAVIANADSVVYVSPNGSDANDGSMIAPFATFQHAIDLGHTNIIGKAGVYRGQRIEASNISNLRIRTLDDAYMDRYSSTHSRRARIVLDNSIDVTGLSSYNGIYRVPLSLDTNSTYYKVFISKTLSIEPIPGLQSISWYAILWEMGASLAEHKKLTPKASIAECQAEQGSFTYDGNYLYINPSNGQLGGKTYKRLNIDDYSFYGVKLTDVDRLNIEDLDVMFYPHGNCWWINCIDAKVKNCDFGFAATWSGNEIQACNMDFIQCIAYKNAADGFAPTANGVVNFYNCQALYNYDDGISHHDGSEGCIDGGFFTGNGKGGIAPAYGSKVNVKNVVALNNGYGCYFVASLDRKTDEEQIITNCTFANSVLYDIRVDYYRIICTRTSYKTKQLNEGSSFTEITNDIIV